MGEYHRFYAFGNYASRQAETPFFFRSPMNRDGVYETGNDLFLVGGDGCQAKYRVPATAENLLAFRAAVVADAGCFSFVERYPQGFTPDFGARITDHSGVVGIRGERGGALRYDISVGIGENRLDGYLDNTLNPSLLFAGGPQRRTGICQGQVFDVAATRERWADAG